MWVVAYKIVIFVCILNCSLSFAFIVSGGALGRIERYCVDNRGYANGWHLINVNKKMKLKNRLLEIEVWLLDETQNIYEELSQPTLSLFLIITLGNNPNINAKQSLSTEDMYAFFQNVFVPGIHLFGNTSCIDFLRSR